MSRPSPKLKNRLTIAGLCLLAIILILAILLAFLSPLSQKWVVKALGDHYHAGVRLANFHVSMFPRPTAVGSGLVLLYKDRPSAPPLASIRRFSVKMTWIGLLRHPRRVRDVRMDGLTINIPPRGHEEQKPEKKKKHHLPPFYFEHISADGTTLNIFSSNPQSPLRVFTISRLQLHSVAVGKAMTFEAVLTNPKPVGQIQTAGEFGPWDANDPGLTPISGRYAFRNADLSTIRGLAGILSSEGEYGGALNLIKVRGETDTPDFGLDLGKNRVDLKTEFDAVVNGIDGNTMFLPVKAELGSSTIQVSGSVLRTTGMTGKTISLTVTADQARLQDLLLVAIKSSTPPLLGTASLHSQLEIFPGQEDIVRRLKLDGSFAIQSARFTDPELEEKITHLSHRGEGRPTQDDGSTTALNLTGRFILFNAVMTFPDLSFDVPGAGLQLHGTYRLLGENLDFRGTLRLKAKVSQTTTGMKSVLLKAIDPLFKEKGAGAVIPIKITGTREHPSFGIQMGKVLKRIK